MNSNGRMLTVLCCSLVVLSLTVGVSEAIYLDKKKTMDFSAKLQARVSLRTEDSSGFTFPEVETWDMVQQRNIAYLEFQHDLQDLINEAGVFKPLRWAGRRDTSKAHRAPKMPIASGA